MKEKVKKVIIQEEGSLFLLCLMTISFTVLLFMIVANYRTELLGILTFMMIITVLCWSGVVCWLRERKNGLYYFTLSQDYITFYSYNDNKEDKISIKLNDISAFKLDIWHRVDNLYVPRSHAASPPFDIKINIQIATNNNESYEFSYSEQNTRNSCISNIFAIAKFIPNFSYTVDTNSDVFKSGLDAWQKNGNLSFYEGLKFVLNDPNVSNLSKTYLKTAIGVLFFFAWLLGMMIIKTIIDIIG